MTVYYVDNAGNDSSSGLSGHPWQTCAAVNSFADTPGFVAGDVITFTGGQTFVGPLTIRGGGAGGINSGTADSYFCVGTGRGSAPPTVASMSDGSYTTRQSNPAIFTIGDLLGPAIAIANSEYIWVDNLLAQGSGVDLNSGVTSNDNIGIGIESTQTTNRLRGVRFTSLTSRGCWGGISAWVDIDGHVGFDDIAAFDCVAHAVQRIGIMIPISFNMDTKAGTVVGAPKTQSSDVYVGECRVYDSPGNTTLNRSGGALGICNCTGGLVERCVVNNLQNGSGTGRGSTDQLGLPGISFIQCDGIVTQDCEAFLIRSNAADFDGEGFDVEPNCTNMVIQRCYAHDNDGCGFLASGGTTVRYCISSNNNKNPDAITGGAGAINVANWSINAELVPNLRGSGDVVLLSNTAYASAADALLSFGDGGAVYAYNNILVSNAAANAVDVWDATLIGNLYYAIGGGTKTVVIQHGAHTYTSLAAMQADGLEQYLAVDYGVFGNPALFDPGGAPTAGTLPAAPVSRLGYWDTTVDSPARDTGIDYALLRIDPGDIDFRHNLNLVRNYDIGAVEFQGGLFVTGSPFIRRRHGRPI